MRQINLAIIVLFICTAGADLKTYAQPMIPKASIPQDIASDVREQIERLYSSDPVERGYAAVRLGNMSSRAAKAVPFLLAMYSDDASLAWIGGNLTSPANESAEALARIGESALGPLFDALKSENREIRYHSQNALRILEGKTNPFPNINCQILNTLAVAIQNEDFQIRYCAVGILGTIKDKRAVDLLCKSLYDINESVRAHAAFCLGKSGGSQAVEQLIKALKDKDRRIQEAAARALSDIKDSRALEPLCEVLKSEVSGLRGSAASALARIGDPRAIQPLIYALEDDDSWVRGCVLGALKTLSGQNYGEDLQKWQKWWEENKEKFIKEN